MLPSSWASCSLVETDVWQLPASARSGGPLLHRITSPWSEPLRSHIAVVGLGPGKRGVVAGEDAVGQGQAADVGAGAQAGRAAAGRVQAVDRTAAGAQNLTGSGVDDQPAEGEHRRRVEQTGPDRADDQRERRLVLGAARGRGLS